MKTIEEIAGETGIDRTVLFRAYKIGKLPGRQNGPGTTVLIDESAPAYKDWLVSHFHMPRTLAATGGMERVAQIAAASGLLSYTRKHRDYARPLVCIFRAVEKSPDDLNGAFASSIGEIMRLLPDADSHTVKAYVEAFREEVLGNICHGNLSTLWQREKLLIAAYKTYLSEFLKMATIA